MTVECYLILDDDGDGVALLVLQHNLAVGWIGLRLKFRKLVSTVVKKESSLLLKITVNKCKNTVSLRKHIELELKLVYII